MAEQEPKVSHKPVVRISADEFLRRVSAAEEVFLGSVSPDILNSIDGAPIGSHGKAISNQGAIIRAEKNYHG